MALKKSLYSLGLVTLLTITFTAGLLTGQSGLFPNVLTAHAEGSNAQPVDVFIEGWNLIESHFIDRDVLATVDPAHIALKAITEALGDTGHTRFLTPEEAKSHNDSMDGRFFGIGAYVGLNEAEQPMITSPIRGAPAEKAGMKAGDLLLAVDGVDVTTWSIDDIISRIKGEKGTPVVIKVLHRNKQEENLTIIRDEIVIPALEWTFIPETKIAHIYLSRFSASASDELKAALLEAQARGAEAIIMDVRNNSGGLLDQAVQVSSQFLKTGNVLQRENAQGERQEYEVRPGGVATDIPMVVLANEISASSAEIFVGAIQDQERGTVIGATTFGTGTILTPFTLSDGSVLLLGTSQWLTAEGRVIRNKGVEPDVRLELPPEAFPILPSEVETLTAEELYHARDKQLNAAIQYLSNCWSMFGCGDKFVPSEE